jgi:hypothetical protein
MTDEQNTETPSAADPQGRLEALVSRRDDLIRQLWLVYRDMSDLMQVDDWETADLDLWGNVTGHSAVQSKLGG